MNLRDLEYFVAVVEHGNFGRAADSCRVSQPTLSTQIAKLEQELGVLLFERGPRGTHPTGAARRLADQARRVLDESRRFVELARTGAEEEGLAGPFHLGGIPTSSPYLLPHLLPVLRERHPRVELFVHERRTARLLEELHSGGIDAALLSPPFNSRGLTVDALVEEPFLAAVPGDHPLATAPRINVASLDQERMLLLEEGHCLRDQTLRACGGGAAGRDFQASSLESLRQMVEAGMGCTLIPAFAAKGPFAAGSHLVIRPLDEPTPSRVIALVWRKSYPDNHALRELAEAWRQTLVTALES